MTSLTAHPSLTCSSMLPCGRTRRAKCRTNGLCGLRPTSNDLWCSVDTARVVVWWYLRVSRTTRTTPLLQAVAQRMNCANDCAWNAANLGMVLHEVWSPMHQVKVTVDEFSTQGMPLSAPTGKVHRKVRVHALEHNIERISVAHPSIKALLLFQMLPLDTIKHFSGRSCKTAISERNECEFRDCDTSDIKKYWPEVAPTKFRTSGVSMDLLDMSKLRKVQAAPYSI